MNSTRVRGAVTLLWLAAIVIFTSAGVSKGNSLLFMVIGTAFFGLGLALFLGFTLEGTVKKVELLAATGWWSLFLPPLITWALIAAYSIAFQLSVNLGILLFYMCLPVLFVRLARSHGIAPNLWDTAAILVIWLPVEWGWVSGPDVPPGSGVIGLGRLFAMPVALYAYLAVGRLRDLGFRFDMSRKDIMWAFVYFLCFMPSPLLLGLPSGFIRPSAAAPNVWHALATLIAIFLFTGLPEEILFRGLVQNFIAKRIRESNRWHPIALIISSVIFGWAHVDNHVAPWLHCNLGPLGSLTIPWVYVVLATIAGIFYGLAYLRTGKGTVAALGQALVDTTWSLAFGG